MPGLTEHTVTDLVAQRVYGLALGYEDLCDHEQLRSDPLLGVLSGKRELDEPLAGKSTLNRLELTGRSKRYHKISYSTESMDRLLTYFYLESHAAPPDRLARARRGHAVSAAARAAVMPDPAIEPLTSSTSTTARGVSGTAWLPASVWTAVAGNDVSPAETTTDFGSRVSPGARSSAEKTNLS